VTTSTVAALLTILGYSLYDTIIVFDRVRENVPRMPRAAFSQIVNRSMSEVLTRSIATTSCTLLPIIALLAFGGSTLKDFAFALLIGVASGAYSSIFIASPVLTHWKEREHSYAARRARIEADLGAVPAYAEGAADVDPVPTKARRTGRLTTPDAETVSAAEFEQMKRDLDIERGQPARHTSTLAQRLSSAPERTAAPKRPRSQRKGGAARPGGAPTRQQPQPATRQQPQPATRQQPQPATRQKPQPAPPPVQPEPAADPSLEDENGAGYAPAPDVAENEGVAPVQKPKPSGASKSKSRNKRHGRRR
jgi:SecD/SecF fusion protein